MHGGSKAVLALFLGDSLFHHAERQFREPGNVVAGIVNHVVVRLELKMALKDEHLTLGQDRGEFLADVRDAFLLHELAQTDLRKLSFALELAVFWVILIQYHWLVHRVRFGTLHVTETGKLSRAVKRMHEQTGHQHWEQVQLLSSQFVQQERVLNGYWRFSAKTLALRDGSLKITHTTGLNIIHITSSVTKTEHERIC